MLTSNERITLKDSVNGDGALAAMVSAADWPGIANNYNTAGATMLWRPDILPGEIAATVVNSAFTALSQQVQNGLILLTQGDKIDATNANIRTAFSSIFGAGATLNALTALAQRAGTRFEVLFSSTQGAANVSTKFNQRVSALDVQQAMLS